MKGLMLTIGNRYIKMPKSPGIKGKERGTCETGQGQDNYPRVEREI